MTHSLLAFTPLLDPLDIHESWWITLVTLALGISIAYKAIRLPDLSRFWRGVLIMTTQITLGMVALSAAVYIVVELIVHRLA